MKRSAAATTEPAPEPTVEGIEVTACERCPALVQSRKGILNGRGASSARIMVIIDRPSREANAKGQTFTGPDRELLDYLLSEAGITPEDDVFYTYVVRCHPLGGRAATAQESKNCREHLMRDISEVKPRVIVTLGAKAWESIRPNKAMLGDVLGQCIPFGDATIIPTYAPMYLMLGKWGLCSLVVAHLEKAQQVARGHLSLQPLDEAQSSAVFVTTIGELEAMKAYLLSDEISVITLDTESFGVSEEWTGLDWLGAEVLCYSFSGLDADGQPIRNGFALPILQKDGADFWGDDYHKAMCLLEDILASDKPKCIQNAGHDIRLIERSHADTAIDPRVRTVHGFTLNALAFDTMLMQRLLDENLPANESAMLNLYTDMPFYEEEIGAQAKAKHHMELAENEVVWTYAALDGDGLARILAALIKRMRRFPKLMWLHDNISIPMVRATWNMTRRGIAIDLDYMSELADRYRGLVASAELAVMEAYGHGTFNLNAPKQVQQALFGTLRLPRSGRKTKAAKSCLDCDAQAAGRGMCEQHDETGKDAIRDIQAMMIGAGEEPHPILDAILDWKSVTKQRSNYVDGTDGEGGIVQFIRNDFRIHPEFSVNRADTGRLGAYRPAIQTIPKNVIDDRLGETNALRRPYIASPGRRLVEADWSQGEVWVLAYRSQDETLLDLLTSGRDVHSYVGRELCKLGVSAQFPKAAVHPGMSESEWQHTFDEIRRKAKVFVFGLPFGMSAPGVAERLHCDEDEAGKLVELYQSQIFPGLKDYFVSINEAMRELGYIEDEFGRRGHVPPYEVVTRYGNTKINSNGKRYGGRQQWEELFRKQVNMPIQAGLSDLQQLVHPKLEEHFEGRLWIVLTVHDSIMAEYERCSPEDEVALMWDIKNFYEDQVRNLVKADGKPLGWEIPVEVSWGDSWGHLKNKVTANGNLVIEGEEA